jgi:hypothetical protein
VQDQTVGAAGADQTPSASADNDDAVRKTRHARGRAHDRTTDQAAADQQPASANESSANSPGADQQDPPAGRQASGAQNRRGNDRGDRRHRNDFFSFPWGGGR